MSFNPWHLPVHLVIHNLIHKGGSALIDLFRGPRISDFSYMPVFPKNGVIICANGKVSGVMYLPDVTTYNTGPTQK